VTIATGGLPADHNDFDRRAVFGKIDLADAARHDAAPGSPALGLTQK
jgi:hypothetical protein